MPVGTLVQITAPHFCAGIVIDSDRVQKAAPILKYMMYWSSLTVKQYCYRKGWKMQVFT